MIKTRTFMLFIPLLILPFNLGAEDRGDVLEVRKALMCTCDDCTMVLYDCHCGTADKMVATIRDMLDTGLGTTEVIQAYAARFGEAILSAPTKKGFNLSAWVFPFVVLGVGSVLVVALLKRWTSENREREDQQTDLQPLDKAYLAKVKQEMKELGI